MRHIWKCTYATKKKNEREIGRKKEDEKMEERGENEDERESERERERKDEKKVRGSDRECERNRGSEEAERVSGTKLTIINCVIFYIVTWLTRFTIPSFLQ